MTTFTFLGASKTQFAIRKWSIVRKIICQVLKKRSFNKQFTSWRLFSQKVTNSIKHSNFFTIVLEMTSYFLFSAFANCLHCIFVVNWWSWLGNVKIDFHDLCTNFTKEVGQKVIVCKRMSLSFEFMVFNPK